MTLQELQAMSGRATLALYNANVDLARSLGIKGAKHHSSGWFNKAKGAEITFRLLQDIEAAQGKPAATPEQTAAVEPEQPKRKRAKKTSMPAPRPKRSRSRKAA